MDEKVNNTLSYYQSLVNELRSYPSAMKANTLHGFLVCVVLSPSSIFKKALLEKLLGFSIPRDTESFKQLRISLDEAAGEVSLSLLEDDLKMMFQSLKESEIIQWCRGFLVSYQLVENEWHQRTFQNPALRKQVHSLLFLADGKKYGHLADSVKELFEQVRTGRFYEIVITLIAQLPMEEPSASPNSKLSFVLEKAKTEKSVGSEVLQTKAITQ